MAIELTEDLLSGNDEIDEQHRQIFERSNTFLAAANQDRGEEIVAGVVDFLEAFCIYHFHAEETAMLTSGYPAYEGHVALHNELMRGVYKLRQKADAEGPSKALVTITSRLLVEILVNHVRKVDRELMVFLRAKA